ncbi:LPXTG cell wall anchor domain-containing protein [Kitasatospora gansuensis]
MRSNNGGLNVMLINKSPQNAAEVSLSYAGFTPAAGAVTTVSYAKEGTALTTAERGTAVAQTLPPYSITTLQLKPASKTAGADKPSPLPKPTAATPTAATPVVSASGTTGSRAQAEKGIPVGHPSPSPSSTSGGLASTGMSDAVTYSAVGGLLAIAAGSVLVLRGRRRKALHGK